MPNSIVRNKLLIIDLKSHRLSEFTPTRFGLASFPGLPHFLCFGLHLCSFASVYYTEHTPKNKKQGRPGNEARLGHSFELTVTLYRNGLSFARLQYYAWF